MAMDFDSLADEEEKRRNEERAKELASTLGLGSRQRAQAIEEKNKLRKHRLESRQATTEVTTGARRQRNIGLRGTAEGIHSPPVSPKSSNGFPVRNDARTSIDLDEEYEKVKRSEFANTEFLFKNIHGIKSQGRSTDDTEPSSEPAHETRPSTSTSLVVQPLEDVIAAIDAEDEAHQLWHSYKELAKIEGQRDRIDLTGNEPEALATLVEVLGDTAPDLDWQDALGNYETVLSQAPLEVPDVVDAELAHLRRQRLMTNEQEAKFARERKLKDIYHKAVHKRMANVDAVMNLTAMPKPAKIGPPSGTSSSSSSKVVPPFQRIGVPNGEIPKSKPAAAEPSKPLHTSSGTYTATQQAWLQPGAMVRLHSLKANPELNGLVGLVEYQDEKNGRWVISLESGVTKSFKQQNIQHEMSESAQATNSKALSAGKPAGARFKAPPENQEAWQKDAMKRCNRHGHCGAQDLD